MNVNPILTITIEDHLSCSFHFSISGLEDFGENLYIAWKILGVGDSVSKEYVHIISQGASDFASQSINGYYPLTNEGEYSEFINFQHELNYTLACNISSEKVSQYLIYETFFFEASHIAPIIRNAYGYQTQDGLDDTSTNGEISCFFDNVYFDNGEIDVIGTLCTLYKRPSGSDTFQVIASDYLHNCRVEQSPFYNWQINLHDSDKRDADIIIPLEDISHGDTFRIQVTNQYTNLIPGEEYTHYVDVALNVVSIDMPHLYYGYTEEKKFSLENGRIKGIIKGAISILHGDWYWFINNLEHYNAIYELNIDVSDVYGERGDALTADKWNKVIKVLKAYYDKKHYLLDDRITEVSAGNKITPEIIDLVNEAFKY